MQMLTSCFYFSFPDNRRSRPGRLPRKPLRPGKGSRQLPPEPPLQGSDEVTQLFPPKHLFNTAGLSRPGYFSITVSWSISPYPVLANDECGQLTPFSQFVVLQEDYIIADCSNDDDNYIEPAENPPSSKIQIRKRGGTLI